MATDIAIYFSRKIVISVGAVFGLSVMQVKRQVQSNEV